MEKADQENRGLYNSSFEHDSCGVGFVAHIKGTASHEIVTRGLEVLERMEHRGAEGADNKTGDGSGIMLQIPHSFYKSEIDRLPEKGKYGTGMVFFPAESKAIEECTKLIASVSADEDANIIAWRNLNVDNSDIGQIAIESEPVIRQIFIECQGANGEELERKLYVIRKSIEKKIRESQINGKAYFYISSLSSKTIVYKGMLTPAQVRKYYSDLRDPDFKSAIALVHSRFSTNTFPSWDLAQPFRMLAHNGEINTIKGNRFSMQSNEGDFESMLLGEDIKKILPVIEPDKSDSASLDNALELLVSAGRSLPHALMMLIPESWNDKNPISDELKFFYQYHSTFMEPWDGPASVVFTDGRYIGGTLDRNGLRPSRYIVTEDDLIVMGSEVGVQNFSPEKIKFKGRLMPGKLLLVDTEEGRIIPDEEIKKAIAGKKPYRNWVEENRVLLSDIAVKNNKTDSFSHEKIHRMHLQFGYNREDVEKHILSMAKMRQEPTSSMGTDTPLAVFSDSPQRLFNYFKQVFAQVTNPAIDPIREELVMSLTSYMGPGLNLLEESPLHCRKIKYRRPVFTNSDINKILYNENQDFKSKKYPIVFDPEKTDLEKSLEELFKTVDCDIDKGINFIILSDRDADMNNAPIPSLLACAGLHHHLIRNGRRNKIGLLVETAEAREVMHFALLFGYGADAVNPYGVFLTLQYLLEKGKLPSEMTQEKAEDNFITAIEKGLLKVMSKMGTSTLRSYRGSQIFEAVGLNSDTVNRYFTSTPSRIEGLGVDEIQKEVLIQHSKAWDERASLLDSDGVYQYRKGGEKHAWNPETIYMLQWASKSNDYEKYKEFSSLVNSQNMRPHVIRGLFEFKPQVPIPIGQVESEVEILKRLTTGAMSFGSLSREAHEAMAIAMNSLGGKSNSGEGGEDPERFITRSDGTLARSAIKQVASGRFGVTSTYLANADEIQIKIAQGAKPGEGGQLPGHKVDKIIAKTRYSTRGVTLISPPPHHDIYSIEDLAQLIYDLRHANPKARISVKLVSESGVGTIAAGVAKAHADLILISGYDGGTGASPQSSIKHAGLPWEIGLSETHQTLVMNDLRDRVVLQTDGQLKTGRDVVMAAVLGAEEFGFGTAALIVLGCVMMRKCHQNTCPVGVATQDPELRKRFKGKPEYLINYFRFMAREIREIMADLGISNFNDLIGNTDLLIQRDIDHWKAGKVDVSSLLYMPGLAEGKYRYCVQKQVLKTEKILDHTLIERARPSFVNGKDFNCYIEMPVSNTDRTVGAMLSYEISSRYGDAGLHEDTIQCTFKGSAGQSFGSFLAPGITFRLEGDANDYLGKGLSGGKIIVVPPQGSGFRPEENIIIGNTVLYGATGGEVYVRGIAGERFCVRNSGAVAVVEGTGDHCAEYMTGGRVIVLGQVGRNFAAGMSGGIAYVLDEKRNFDYFCNQGMVELSSVRDYDDQDFIIEYLHKHVLHTGSTVARNIIDNWYEYLPKFVKVIPLEYKRALKEIKIEQIDEKLKRIREEEQLEVAF